MINGLTPKQRHEYFKQIEESYRRQIAGRLLSVTKIQYVFDDALSLIISGLSVDEATELALEMHCTPKKP